MKLSVAAADRLQPRSLYSHRRLWLAPQRRRSLCFRRPVPVWQLAVSEDAWCVVSLLDVTLFRACYSFFNLLCQSHAPSLFFAFSSFFSGCVSHAPLSLSSSLSTRVNVAEVSPAWQPPTRWKDPLLIQARQTLAHHSQTAFSTSH